MKWLTPTGRPKDIRGIHLYKVDWEGDQGSLFSEEVLDLLYPYWKHDIVFAELPVAGTRLRYDYVNLSKKIICECDGKQHDLYSAFMHGNPEKYKTQIKNDLLKDKAAEVNKFKMVRIKPAHLPLLRVNIKDWFLKTHNITL